MGKVRNGVRMPRVSGTETIAEELSNTTGGPVPDLCAGSGTTREAANCNIILEYYFVGDSEGCYSLDQARGVGRWFAEGLYRLVTGVCRLW